LVDLLELNETVLSIGPMQFALYVNLKTHWSPSLKNRLTQKYDCSM